MKSQYAYILEQFNRKRKNMEIEVQSGPSEFVKNLVKNLKLDEIELKEARLYSNNMAKSCKSICKICKDKINLNYMRQHTKKEHKISIKDYGRLYGHHRTHMVEPVYYHRCPFCQKDLLLDADDIHKHVGTHGVKLKDYSAKFIVSVWKREQEDEGQEVLGLDNDTRKSIGELFDSL